MCNEKKLELRIQPKVIELLGIQMYQKPVDAVSEYVANAWDADAENVNIFINDHEIIISDDGIGMSFNNCQDYFLTVARDRRNDLNKEISEEKKRPVLGRKGIGKFAGFGIAKKIEIETISKSNRDSTKFLLDIDKILEIEKNDKFDKDIKVLEYKEDLNSDAHKTIIKLQGNNIGKIDLDNFKLGLSQRFLLPQTYDDFRIFVNTEKIPDSFNHDLEFVFPKVFKEEEKIEYNLIIDIDEKGWAHEKFKDYDIYWRIGFFEATIKNEELRGISIYTRGKLSQKPFFFEFAGGMSGQNSLEYLTGQIKMDFIDQGEFNLISTERQRINLQTPIGQDIKTWGIELIKFLAKIWQERRSEKRIQELNDKIAGFGGRLAKLPSSERRTIESVLKKIATFERLGKARFHDWCTAILTSWETGRLKELIIEISETKELDENKLLEILSEADVLTALNIAESIKTKILSIGELKQRVNSRQLENNVRDFIYDHPWIINPKWESFRKEISVKTLINQIGSNELDKDDIFNGRVDLALSAGSELLLIEFMRPGLEIDRDHLDRIYWYVINIRDSLNKQTGHNINNLGTAYIIADSIKNNSIINTKIKDLSKDNILFLTWEALIGISIKQWEEHLVLLKERNPDEPRIQEL